ncbi:amidase [Hoeflea sp.]|uniref:amidase n=1 Tax=Hoeflea sp. TaxID=1940281 RepID=UPI003B01F83C
MSRLPDSVSSQVAALAQGTEAPTSLAERALDRAAQRADLNAFVALDRPIVMAQAEAATRRRRNGDILSPIDGVPIAVKDNYLTQDYPTTACSNARPLERSGVDATVVANLRAAGAVIFGKTNMHEWAYGATNTTSAFGPTRNPCNSDHITGGSSGGSGAAVAAAIVGAALGSDTGGSVRIPAGACGTYGYKPSYGRSSRNGVLALSWSLDAPGPLCSSLADLPLLLPYFLGPDPADPATRHARPFDGIPPCERPRLVNLKGPGLERSPEVDAAVSRILAQSGAEVCEAGLSDVASYFAAWETILHCEASSYHSKLLGSNPGGYSPVTRAHLEAGKKISAVDYLKALRIRTRFLDMLFNDLPEWDALVLPTLPVPAPRADEEQQEFGGRCVTTQDSMTWFCWPGNLAGLPCISLPLGQSSLGLPIGVMLMGRPGSDERLLSVAKWVDDQVRQREPE